MGALWPLLGRLARRYIWCVENLRRYREVPLGAPWAVLGPRRFRNARGKRAHNVRRCPRRPLLGRPPNPKPGYVMLSTGAIP